MNNLMKNSSLEELGREIASNLARSFVHEGIIHIQTPLLMPSGSYIVVTVRPFLGGMYRVSDTAQGAEEADMNGLRKVYLKHLRNRANACGLTINEDALFVDIKGKERLKGAICSIASNVLMAIDCAFEKNEEKKLNKIESILIPRLHRIYGLESVSKRSVVTGSSMHSWKVSAMVENGKRSIVFDAVSDHPTSIAFASTKFTDLSSCENAFIRVAVIDSDKKYTDIIKVVAQVARIIKVNANDNVYLNAGKVDTFLT